MPPPGPKSRRLTIYLLKEEFSRAEEILPQRTRLRHQAIRGIGDLYIRPSRPHPPAWADFFTGAANFSGLSISHANSAAILLMDAGGRDFALTFGFGKSFLEPGSWEERFGLRVTLNSLDPKKIRSIDKRSFDAIARHSREQASREVSAAEFGLNIELDMLRAATGRPRDPLLGSRMSGMDALSVTVKVELAGLRGLLDRYLTQFQSEEYRRDYPWVDQIAEVSNPNLKAELEAELVNSIKATDMRVWMAVPEIIDWTDVAGFRYSPSEGNPLHDDLSVADFLSTVRKPEDLTPARLKQRKVYCFSESAGAVAHQWPVYRCLYFEADRDGTIYLLTDGKWHSINRDFVGQINAEVSRIQASSLGLPDYSDSSEEEYNRRVADSDRARYALMDQVQIQHGGGRSSIEFCDLFTTGKEMVHIKRYAGSSVLSHLFAQGLVSAEVFYMDSGYRARLNDKLPGSHKLQNPGEQPKASDYPVVFGVVSRDRRDLRLPFFSKVNLRVAARRLQGFGFSVYLDTIINTREGPEGEAG